MNIEGHRQLLQVVILGLLIRVLLLPFSLHVDQRFTGDIVAFSRLAGNWTSAGAVSRNFLYPPLAYITLDAYINGLMRPFLGDVLDRPIAGAASSFNWLASPRVFRTLFLLKGWYLWADLGIAVVLWRLFREQVNGRVALLSWAFNPFILYTAYFHGQFDLVPVFFVLLSLYMVRRGSYGWAAFWLGIGACYKNYPLLFMAPLVLLVGRSWRARFKLILAGVGPYLALFIPYAGRYLRGSAHIESYFLPAGYDLGFGARVYLFLALYAVILWHLYRHSLGSFDDVWRALFAILLVYYQFSYFDLHYWVWIVPFAIIYGVERPRDAKPFYLVIALSLLVLMAPTPLGRFLAPVSPRFFLRLSSLMEVLNSHLPMLFIVNVVRSLMAGTCFYLAWRLLRDMPVLRDGVPQTTIPPTPVV